MNKVIYIADIDQDIDDIIAADFLNQRDVLEGIVLDPEPKSEIGLKRVEEIKKMGVQIFKDIPKCDYIFNGGAFTKLAKYLRSNTVKIIVANGGFVGDNLAINPLDKFKGKKYVRTFNFNIDVNATINVLNSKSYDELYLIGKNVCHSEKNTLSGIWKDKEFLKKYYIKDDKRLHDVLMVQEGIKIINNEDSILAFAKVNCIYENIDGNYTKWGSEKGNKANAAIGWK